MSSDQDAKLGRLVVCPKCGSDGDEHAILYVEKTEVSRQVCGIKNGAVAVELTPRTQEGKEDRAYPCFECRSPVLRGVFAVCGHRWPAHDAPIVYVPDEH